MRNDLILDGWMTFWAYFGEFEGALKENALLVIFSCVTGAQKWTRMSESCENEGFLDVLS